MKRFLVVLLFPVLAYSHGLAPQRFQLPKSSHFFYQKFKALNYFKTPETFIVECFKHEIGNEYPCDAFPYRMYVGANNFKTFSIRLEPDTDDIYFVCTKSLLKAEAGIVTRVCARIGVGIDPTIQASDPIPEKPTEKQMRKSMSRRNFEIEKERERQIQDKDKVGR